MPAAYADPRFFKGADSSTGYHTKNILAAPVLGKDGSISAVVQAINKVNGVFTTEVAPARARGSRTKAGPALCCRYSPAHSS